MSQDPWRSVEQLARHYQEVADGRASPQRDDRAQAEPIGWRSGALATYRRCADDLCRLLEERRRDEEARQFAASPIVLADGGAPWMPLELKRGFSGPRHHLDGRAVRRGDLLELLLPAARALRGRYEWDAEGRDGVERPPALVIEVAGGAWGEVEAVLHLPPEARLRWPPEAA